jgi:hypothetical protein
MSVASGPVTAIFLILVATSMAVVLSMIVLALFDRAFKKKSAVAKDENQASGLPERMTVIRRATAKSFAVLRHHSKVRHQSGCGPQTQRVRNVV